jgi:hypothetical protein
MMLVTVLAILAVDFPVFPCGLAKYETCGVSFLRTFIFSSVLAAILSESVDGHGRWRIRVFTKGLSPQLQSSSLSNIQRI